MTSAAVYTRVSTDEQARHGVSLEAQLEARLVELERLQVEAVGAALPGEGATDALAAWTRRGTGRMLEALRAGPVEGQLAALRALYERVEVGAGVLTFRYRLPVLEAATRAIPKYWCPSKGCTKVGF